VSSRREYWSPENQRLYVDSVGQRLGISEGDLATWYQVRSQSLIKLGASTLLSRYNGSLYALLSAVYPDFAWDPRKFLQAPRHYWADIHNQRSFLDSLASKLGFKAGEREGWYKVSNHLIAENGGAALLRLHSGNFSQILQKVYPDFAWDPLRFRRAPKNYWSSIENQRAFLDGLGKKLGYKEGEREAWYKISNKTIVDYGGVSVLVHYHGSVPALLAAVYPDYNWELWKFPGRSDSIRKDSDTLLATIDAIEEALHIREPKDWYRVTREQLQSLGLARIFPRKHGGMSAVLKQKYPNCDWEEDSFFGRGHRLRARQSWLRSTLTKLFPGEAILESYSVPELISTKTGRPIELDIFLPTTKLAFEIQSDARSDIEKSTVVSSQGITLILVPPRWKKRRGPLLAALLAVRPDLFDITLKTFLKEAQRATGKS